LLNIAGIFYAFITTQTSVFDVALFGHGLPSGLSLRVEDKAEWLSRNEIYSVLQKIIFVL
jgi:hypothetical protein